MPSERYALLQELVDHVPAMLAYWGADQRCRLANRAYETWFAITAQQMIGKTMREVLGPLYVLNLPYIERALRGEPQQFEREIPDPHGGPPRFSLASYVPHVVDGEVCGFFVLVADITARKRADEATREAENDLRLAIDNAPIGMAIVDLTGRWLRVNRVLCELLGYSSEELLVRRFQDVTHPDDLQLDVEHLEKLLRGVSSRYQLAKRYIRKDGRVVEVMLHVSLARDERGDPKHFITQIEDLTERKKLEAQAMLADRLASIGRLSAAVAHEINNPLAYVLANLDAVNAELAKIEGVSREQRAELLALVAETREGAERVRGIVGDLKTFSRGGGGGAALLDVTEALEAALTMTANEVRHRAVLVREYGKVAPVRGDKAKLTQVFVNLVANAAQAIPEGHADGNRLTIRTFMDAEGRVVVEVEDTGSGIPRDVLGRIFEPFFTTKPIGVGTGLGLSVSHGIVASLGGEIVVDSEPGVRTWVRVVLPPAAANELPAVVAQAITPSAPAGEVRGGAAASSGAARFPMAVPGPGQPGSGEPRVAREEAGLPIAGASSPAAPMTKAPRPAPGPVPAAGGGPGVAALGGPVESGLSAGAKGKTRVLVVDDEPALVRAMARVLGDEHEVVTATSGAKALELAMASTFDAIVSDLMMPNVTGMDLHAALVERSPEQAARMVFITGGAFTAAAQKFLAVVPNARFEKPVEIDTLKAAVLAVVKRPRASQAPGPSAQSSSQVASRSSSPGA